MITQLTVITHYAKGRLGGDYYDVEIVLESTGEVIAQFGDHYHDKGLEKAEGFIEGVAWARGGTVIRANKKVDDR